MTTQTIRNGTSIDVPIPTGQTLKVVAVTGTYTITVTRGTGIGTALATAATGGSYGAYAYDSVVRIVASSASEIDFDVAVTPSVATDTVANYAFDPLTGAVTGLVGPGGKQILIAPSSINKSVLTIGGDHPYKQWWGADNNGLGRMFADLGISPYLAICADESTEHTSGYGATLGKTEMLSVALQNN